MDSTTLLLVVGPILLGLVGGAFKFMRFVGFVASGGKKSPATGRTLEQLSFDERVSQRLRELEQDPR